MTKTTESELWLDSSRTTDSDLWLDDHRLSKRGCEVNHIVLRFSRK